MENYTATYSPEDNKLRLYSLTRLDDETYQKVKEAGFKWAPKQELFVAPMWTPEREDLLMDLAGEIEPEEMTLAERAAAKAERIDAAIERKRTEADAYHRAANLISERFYMGQPILVGHHSERKARKDQEKMHRAMSNASASMESVRHLAWKAEGCERHANRKNRSDVRARRIKTLLAELRDMQRKINHGHACLELWEKIGRVEDQEKRAKAAEYYAGMRGNSGSFAPWDAWSDLRAGKKTVDQTISEAKELAEHTINNQSTYRWIEHILNRLSFERSELGQTKKYEGPLRETILQMFARENGAEGPKAKKTEGGYILVSAVPLPLHIGEGKEKELSENEWRELMQSCGYEVADKESKPAAPPLLNIDVHQVTVRSYGRDMDLRVIHITKEEFSGICNDYKGTCFTPDKSFRVRTGFEPGKRCSLVAFFLTNSKAHEIPESGYVLKKEDAA